MSKYDPDRDYEADGYASHAGRWLLKDETTGVIIDSVLPADVAREMGAKGGALGTKAARAKASELASALADVIIDEDSSKAPALKILIGQLAAVASKDSAASLRAIEAALALVGEGQSKLKPPEYGQRCRLCGETLGANRIDIRVSRELVARYPTA